MTVKINTKDGQIELSDDVITTNMGMSILLPKSLQQL